jgi:hypothetical protein
MIKEGDRVGVGAQILAYLVALVETTMKHIASSNWVRLLKTRRLGPSANQP